MLTTERNKRWQEFHEWEREYEIKKLRSMSPAEKIKIYEDMYKFVLEIEKNKKKHTKSRRSK